MYHSQDAIVIQIDFQKIEEMVELITQFIHELVLIGDCQQANLITLVRELSTVGLDDDQITPEMKQEYDEQILHFHEYIQVGLFIFL